MGTIDTATLVPIPGWGMPDWAPLPVPAEAPRAADPEASYATGAARRTVGYPFDGDEVTLDHLCARWGDAPLDRMLKDDKVHASVHTLKQAILADDVQLTPAYQDVPEDDESDDAPARRADAKASKEVNRSDLRAIARIPGGLVEWLYQMLDALVYRSMLSEVAWERPADGPDAGQWTLGSLRVLPRTAWQFGLDPYGVVAGYFVETPDDGTVYLEKTKYARLTWMPRQGDPRGTTICDAAFKAWNFKRELYPELFDYIDKHGSPSLVGKTPPRAQPRVPRGPDGLPIQGAAPIPAAQDLADQLKAFRSNSILAVSAETEVEQLEVKGEGNVHFAAFDLMDRAIVHAILQVTRATMESEHGSKADSGQASDVFSLLVRIGKHFTATVLREQVLLPLNVARYGRDWAQRYTSRVQLGMVERQDQAMLLNAVANLVNAGALHPSDVPRILRWSGLPVEASTVPVAQLQQRPNGAGSDIPAKPAAPAPAA
jgi:hypothetical protein